MKIKIGDNVRISKLRSEHTSCSYCNGKLTAGKHYLIIDKMSASGNPISIWFHPSCIKDLNNDINKFLNNDSIMKELMCEDL